MGANIRFSLVELVSIVLILAVVARTIAPPVAEADAESKVSELIDGLERMRAQLDLYRVQHDDCLPPCGSFGLFETAMTTKAGGCGPYVGRIPANPFNNVNTVRFDGEPAGCGKAGWRLDTKTGLFQADNDAVYAAL
ncbi:MAG TPA: hypothetical protein VMW16_16080 [Sedimentisphaerales bacterium]|nr:hypothetical protein [Sedimentisphaerales bacterium]